MKTTNTHVSGTGDHSIHRLPLARLILLFAAALFSAYASASETSTCTIHRVRGNDLQLSTTLEPSVATIRTYNSSVRFQQADQKLLFEAGVIMKVGTCGKIDDEATHKVYLSYAAVSRALKRKAPESYRPHHIAQESPQRSENNEYHPPRARYEQASYRQTEHAPRMTNPRSAAQAILAKSGLKLAPLNLTTEQLNDLSAQGRLVITPQGLAIR